MNPVRPCKFYYRKRFNQAGINIKNTATFVRKGGLTG